MFDVPQFGLDLDIFDLHNTFPIAAEHRPGDAAASPVCLNRQACIRVWIVARLLVFCLGNRDAAIARHGRALTILILSSSGRSKTGDCRPGISGCVFNVATLPSNSTVTPFRPVSVSSPAKLPSFSASPYSRFRLKRLFRRHRRHIDRIGNRAGQQIVGHLFRHLQRDVFLRFFVEAPK